MAPLVVVRRRGCLCRKEIVGWICSRGNVKAGIVNWNRTGMDDTVVVTGERVLWVAG